MSVRGASGGAVGRRMGGRPDGRAAGWSESGFRFTERTERRFRYIGSGRSDGDEVGVAEVVEHPRGAGAAV
ncbi:MAG TPA: hypothetical protein VLK57_13540, partial [Pseudonocardia sp.]|nr:hypothetical protein [Pseudonocardia sp.]